MMLYQVTYYSKHWQKMKRDQWDPCVELPVRLGAQERALAVNTNDNGHAYYWNGGHWIQGVPPEVEAKRKRQENAHRAQICLDKLREQVVGVMASGHGPSTGHYPRHPMLERRVLLRRKDEQFEPILAQIKQVYAKHYRVWLPEYRCELFVHQEATLP